MSRALLARKPVSKERLSYDSDPVAVGVWVEVVAALKEPASAVEIFNGSGSTLKISVGAAGQETTKEIPYFVLPGGSSILLPFDISKGARVSVTAVDTDATTGSLILNFFG